MLFVIPVDGFGGIDIVAHHGDELNTHSQPLKIPNIELVSPQLSGLQVLKETIMFLCGDLPALKTGAKRVILRLHDGRLFQNMV